VRLVLEPRSSRVDRDEFVNTLLAQTSLEGNVSVNLVCIGLDGRPAQRSLRDILVQWLAFRSTTMTRRTRFRLDKVTDRIHVLEGRMVVYLNVDEVIQTIRDSDEPRAALMDHFDLTERQAEDILEMRLRQLARLEGIKIEQELEKQRVLQAELAELLDNPRAFKRLMIREIEADAKAYGDDRRTLIETAERAVLETRVVKEPVTVIVSHNGWLRSRQGHGPDAQQFSFKSGDSLYDAIECQSTDDLVVFSDTGRVYTVAVANLPSARGDGQPVTAMIDMEHGARIMHTISGHDKSRYLIGVRSGYGFISMFENMTSRQRAGKQFISVESGEVLLEPLLVRDTDDHVALLSEKGRMLIVALAELRVLAAGGRGTRLMDLDADDAIAQWAGIGPDGLRVTGIYRRKDTTDTLTLDDLAQYMGRRARRGRAFVTRIREPRLLSA